VSARRRPTRRARTARPAAKARSPRRAARPLASKRTAKPQLEIVRGDVHAAHGLPPRPVCAAVLTLSDTRRGQADVSGARAQEMLEQAGVEVARRAWARDQVGAIRRVARAILALPAVDVLVVSGGTGPAPRDVAPEAFAPLLDRTLPGFGERFRARSAEQVGAAAWLSRALAGVARGRLVVLLPGSPAAVELALRELLLPELVHAVRLLGRFDPPKE